MTDIINQLANDGIGIPTLKKKLKNEFNLNVTENVIKRHLDKYGILPNETNQNIESPVISGVVDTQNRITVSLNDINLDGYNFDKDSPNSIVAYLQKCHLGIYLKQLEITYQELEEYHQGLREIPPTIAIRNLRMLFELLDSITGISVYSNQQAAINSLINKGYDVRFGKTNAETN